MNKVKPLRVSQDALTAIADEPRLPGAIMASGVTAFAVTHAGSEDSVSPPITVLIGMERSGNTGRRSAEQYEQSQTYALRNH
jgi:hypothetical protein